MARPIATNKDVFQSYVLTTAKYEFSVYEKRIMYRLVELAQASLNREEMMKNPIRKITPTLWGKEITMPVTDILANEEDKNYALAKKAFKSLATKGVEYEDDKTWSFTNIITSPKIDKGTGIAVFKVENSIWECILNFTKGYRKYELKTAMQFKSVYSMRMYELMSGQIAPISYGLEDLKERFHIKSKYQRADNFEKSILDTAKAELDECSPYTFTYERITVPSRGRGGVKTIGYTFFPHKLGKNRDPELEAKSITPKVSTMGMFGTLDKRVQDYLMHNIGIDKAAANKNKETLNRAQELFGAEGMIDKLAAVIPRLRKVSNPIGYVINALKSEIAAEEKKRRGVANVVKSV